MGAKADPAEDAPAPDLIEGDRQKLNEAIKSLHEISTRGKRKKIMREADRQEEHAKEKLGDNFERAYWNRD